MSAEAPGAARAHASPERGLSSDEARRRLARHGPNELKHDEPPGGWRILVRQLANPLVPLLAAAAIIAAVVADPVDAAAIAAILVLNAIVGFLQEHRAERALHALRTMTAPRARVVRDGASSIVAARDVVPGDVLVLEPGDVIAADARLLDAAGLRVVEAMLIGESAPSSKVADRDADGVPLAERRGSVFAGTAVAAGTGRAEVTATGMGTEMGRIASLLATAESGLTPLQVRLHALGRTLAMACLGVTAIVMVLGLLRGDPLGPVIVTAIALAVAAVPEGLPAVVTIALAVGVQRLAKRNVLVRRLPAVESLGSTTVICTDKTGTLTTGEMTLRDTWGPDDRAMLRAAAACADAELAADGAGIGDPTELALLRAARELGIERAAIESDNPRVAVRPFDPATRSMAVRRADGLVRLKGAVEAVLPSCDADVGDALAIAAEMSSRGLRVLAVAEGAGPEERGLRLLGLVGIADPPRPQAVEAIAAARRAGIRTVMITGDNAATARAIAEELGILDGPADPAPVVHARATPEDKLRIVREWKGRGHVVAMTGDGVNDAPAVREASVGIVMGRTGTDVTREAADLVLTDDRFASIVAAVREGRAIHDNIRKTVVYLLTGNLAELGVMLGAALAGWPLPLVPLQLLWINLVTDGLPALALVVDPPSTDVLERPPRDPRASLVGRQQWAAIAVFGAVEAAVVLATFGWVLAGRGPEHARAMAFTTLVFSELLRVFAARDPSRTFLETRPLSNLKLIAVIVASGALQFGILHLEFLRRLFDLPPLTIADGLICVAIALIPVSLAEIAKLVRRSRVSGSSAPHARTEARP